MTINGIADNVQELLESLNSPTRTFVTILDAEPEKESDFSGYPSVCHYFDDAEGNYATVSQNRRVYQYVVEMYVMGDTDTTNRQLRREAYTLTDTVIDLFDHSIDLKTATKPRACDIMRPTPAEFEAIQTKEGKGYLITLRLFCEADITFRNA